MIVVYTTTLSSSLAIKKKCQEVLNFLQAHKVSSNMGARVGTILKDTQSHFSINLYWRISGGWARPYTRPCITGKLINQKYIRTYSFFSKSGQILENSSSQTVSPMNLSRHLVHDPKIEISKKLTSFPVIRTGSWLGISENWNIGNNFGWVFQDLPIRIKTTCVAICQ